MVRIQAQTIRRGDAPVDAATGFVVAPTPMIEPVMVCVVETGMPQCVAMNSVIAPAVSAQNPPTGRSLVILMPIVFTMRQPPSAVPMRHRGVAGEDDPERARVAQRQLGVRAHVPRGDEQRDDDAHRLLRVVAAVAERVERRRDELQPPEQPVDLAPGASGGTIQYTTSIRTNAERAADAAARAG